ncbi:MAG: methyltransferase family protein [Solirubrobacterales bacterium]
MVTAALVLLGVFLVLTFGVRVGVQVRRTGTTGLKGIRAGAGSVEWFGGVLFVLSTLLGGIAPVLVATGVLDPIEALDTDAVHAAGIALAVAGIVGVFAAQMAMGDAWRIGVDPGERTELVTGGIFSLCRNPIYTAMLTAWIGFALMVPTPVSIAVVPLVLIGLEIQVRFAEEPHLLRSHGEAYRSYAARVGRFLPGIGRLG